MRPMPSVLVVTSLSFVAGGLAMMETNYRLQPAFPLEPGVAHRLDGASLLLLRGKASDEWTREAGKVPRGQDDGGAPTAGIEGDARQLEQPRVDVSRQAQQVATRGHRADLQTRERLEV